MMKQHGNASVSLAVIEPKYRQSWLMQITPKQCQEKDTDSDTDTDTAAQLQTQQHRHSSTDTDKLQE
jgi:hypothetical protein